MEGLRQFLMSWKGKVLLVVCVSPMALLGLESFFQSSNNPNDIAKVGKTAITATTYQNTLNERLDMLTKAVKDTSLINQEVLKDQVLQGLIDRTLLDNQINKLGMTVSDEAIIASLKTDPAFLDDNKQFSNDLFANFLRERGMTKDQLFASIRSQNALRQFISNIANTAIYPVAGITGLLDLQTQQRPVWVARLPWQPYASQVTVTDKDISDYYNAHLDDMKSQALADVTYLSVDKALLNVPPVTEAELNQHYQTYVASQTNNVQYDVAMILVSGDNAQATIGEVKNQLDKKADFATLAKQYSQDDGSKNNGGNIGDISKAMFPQDYDKVLSAVKALKIGETTAAIQTQYGYQIFKLNKIDGTTPPSLASVRDTMLQQATENKREIAYQAVVKQLNDMATSGQAIKDMASKLSLTVQTIKDYPKDNNTTVINQPAVTTAVFDDSLIKERGTSVGVDLKGKTVWVQPNNYRPVKTLTLAEATPQIRTMLIQNKAKELALVQAKQIASQVQQLNSISIKGLPAGVTFESLGSITRQDDKLLAEEKSAAFSQPATADKLAVSTAMTSQGASVLVGGVMETSATMSIPAKTKLEMVQKIRDNLGDAQLQDYLHYLRSVNEVKITPSVTNKTAE